MKVQIGSPFKWTQKKEKASLLVAKDDLSDKKIATKLGVSIRTLFYWKKHPEFIRKVRRHLARYETDALRSGIASKVERVQAMNSRWEKLQQVMIERALDGTMKKVPGGRTGLIILQKKLVGSKVVTEALIDTSLLKELREHENLAARHLGQLSDVTKHVGADGGPIDVRNVHEMSDKDLEAIASGYSDEEVIDLEPERRRELAPSEKVS